MNQKDIYIDDKSRSPIYQQIEEQVRQLIATKRCNPGDRLPSIRKLANQLQINIGTVVKAYMELEREGIVVGRRGGGTTVSASSANPSLIARRHNIISNMVNNSILEILSLGYSIEDLETIFDTHLARWRTERNGDVKTATASQKNKGKLSKLNIVCSHDLALNMAIDILRNREPKTEIDIAYSGSLGGLIALQEEKAHLAGIHLLDEATGEYNYPYIKHILPGRKVAVVHFANRIQGLMFISNNPKRIKKLQDLKRADIMFVNRKKGTGTRVLLDHMLSKEGINPSDIRGYDKEVDTHLEVAIAIANGAADIGLGIEAAARSYSLSFLPLQKERYDLVIPIENYANKVVHSLLETIGSSDFKEFVTKIGGYDISQTGDTKFYK